MKRYLCGCVYLLQLFNIKLLAHQIPMRLRAIGHQTDPDLYMNADGIQIPSLMQSERLTDWP